MVEVWKDIVGFEGLYQVSSKGRIKSLAKEKIQNQYSKEIIMKPQKNMFGYMMVSLIDINKKRNTKTIHRIVANHFIKKIDGKNEVNHIDSDKTNNSSDNLEWVTRSENIRHSFRTTNRNGTYKGMSGDLHNKSIPVLKFLNGKLVQRYGSINEASRKTGISSGLISSAIKRNGTSGGYYWAKENGTSINF